MVRIKYFQETSVIDLTVFVVLLFTFSLKFLRDENYLS